MDNISYIFLYFIIYSFLGWVYESTLCSVQGKKLVNRGFLNGPICPIYGCGALVIMLFFPDKSIGIPALFLSSAVLTTILEYITSYLLEKFFHAKWWDYSEFRFNLNGRVCLLGAIVFGVLSVLLIKLIHPLIKDLVSKISPVVIYILSGAIAVFFILDIVVSIITVLKLNQKLKEFQETINEYIEKTKVKAEEIKDNIFEMFESSEFYTNYIKNRKHKAKFTERRLLRAFPKMKSINYNEALIKFKGTFKNLKAKKSEK